MTAQMASQIKRGRYASKRPAAKPRANPNQSGRRTAPPGTRTSAAADTHRKSRGPAAHPLQRAPKSVLVGAALLLLSPLAGLPIGLEALPLSKAVLAGIGVTLILIGPRDSKLPRPVAIVLLACVTALVVAASLAAIPSASFFGRYPRYEGLWTICVYVGALAAGARIRQWPSVIKPLTAVLSVAALLALIGTIPDLVSGGAGDRVNSLLGNASELGLWACMAALLLTPAAIRKEPLAIAGAAAAVLALVLSASRGALLGFVVGAVVLILVRYRSRTGLAVVGGVVGVALLVLVVPFARSRVLGTDAVAGGTARDRWAIWESTWNLIQQHLLFGVGPSGFVDSVPARYTDEFVLGTGRRFTLDSPHNLLLQILVVGGLLLLAAAGALFVCWVLAAIPAVRNHAAVVGAPIAAMAAALVALQTHFTTPGTAPLLAALAGFVVARPARRDGSPPDGTAAAEALGRWTPAAVVSLATLVLVGALLAEVAAAGAVDALGRGQADAAASDWRLAHRLRPWDGDLVLREARAYDWAVSNGTVPADACLAPTADAVAARPGAQESSVDRAKCLSYNGDLAAAKLVLAAGLRNNPKSTELLVLSGRAELLTNDPKAARPFFIEALRLYPGDKEAQEGLAQAEAKLAAPAH